MMLSKTEARLETGFIILYEEGEWLVGYYAYKGKEPFNSDISLHIFNRDEWGALEKDYKIVDIPKTVREKFWFWLNMMSE